jgi:hypothetical protein
VVNLITRAAWSPSTLLTDTDGDELPRRSVVQANSLRVNGFKRYLLLVDGLAGGIAVRQRPPAARYGRIATASASLKSGHLDQAKRYCLGLA